MFRGVLLPHHIPINSANIHLLRRLEQYNGGQGKCAWSPSSGKGLLLALLSSAPSSILELVCSAGDGTGVSRMKEKEVSSPAPIS